MDESVLLHCIQRERGATCAWVASGGKLKHFHEILCEWRANANSELRKSNLAVPADLARLRSSADQMAHGSEGCSARHFYSVFSGFNHICSSFVQRQHKFTSLLEFARLKEATGVERAFLCGVLSLPKDEVPALPPRAFADFVLCCHAQRAHAVALRASAPQSLLEMIETAFELSPDLALVRKQLQENFDLEWVRSTFSVQQWWELITNHIDKLQALQTTLLRELRCRDAQPGTAAVQLLLERAIEVLAFGHGRAPQRHEADACKPVREATAADLQAMVEHADAHALQEALAALLARRAHSSPRAGSGSEARDSKQRAASVAGVLPPSNTSGLTAVQEDSEASLLIAAMATSGDPMSARISGLPESPPRPQPQREAAVDVASSGAPTRSPLNRLPLQLGRSTKCFRIGLEDITFERQIGIGSGGTLYLARWSGRQVAVKVASGAVEAWHTETVLLASLSHPNIVQYLGAVVSPPTYCMVMEHCDGSDLRQALEQATPSGLAISATRCIAAGMAYLHSRGIMHRDLKSANVLICGPYPATIKLGDFGLAAGVPNSASARAELTAEAGTSRWMAPELFRRDGYKESADVYSYGMLLFELITHELPFADVSPLQAAFAVSVEGARPPLPRDTPQCILTLTERCWASEPERRPSFGEIATLVTEKAWLTAAEIAWFDAPLGHPVYTARHTTAADQNPAAAPCPSQSEHPYPVCRA